MRYFKTIENGHVILIGTGSGGEEITEQEYDAILTVIRNKPIAQDGFEYLLKPDLTWEECPLRPVESEPPTDEEALTNYVNELTGSDDPDLVTATETLITEIIKEN